LVEHHTSDHEVIQHCSNVLVWCAGDVLGNGTCDLTGDFGQINSEIAYLGAEPETNAGYSCSSTWIALSNGSSTAVHVQSVVTER
jgi:hypothetical protein